MSDRYIVAGNFHHQPSKKDNDYARAFELIAKLLEASPKSEHIALRLSTCRNAFLTLNAVFVTLKKALGRGSRPSLAARAIFELRRNDPAAAVRVLDELRELLASVAQKWQVWEDREKLDLEIGRLVTSTEVAFKPHEQAEVLSILNNVAFLEPESGEEVRSWDPVYLAIGNDEPGRLAGLFVQLHQADVGLQTIAQVGRAISKFIGAAPELMASDAHLPGVTESVDREQRQMFWQALYQKVADAATPLGVRLGETKAPIELRFPRAGSACIEYVIPSDSKTIVDGLLDHLDEIADRIYEDLCRFRPNRGSAPMPGTYEIDLSPPVSLRTNRLTCTLDTVPLSSEEHATSVRIAFPNFGWPLTAYTSGTDVRFREEYVSTIERAIEAAVTTAIAQNVDVIVFPEYFVPERCIKKCVELTNAAKMVFIAGQEGTRNRRDRKLENIAIIGAPGLAVPKKQFKHFPSVNEPSDFSSEGKQYVFTNSRIGTFTVVVCSDSFEHHIIDAIASADPMVDIVFLCGFNPGYEALFHHLAIADSARLFAHIVVANNASGADEKSVSANGSGVYLPSRKIGADPTTRGMTIPLTFETVFKQTLSLQIVDLAVGDVRESRERDKPRGSLLAVPNFRRKFNVRGMR